MGRGATHTRESGPIASNRGLRQGWRAAREFVEAFLEHDPFTLAAATSYYTLLSLAPLLLIVVGLASLIFEREAVEGRVLQEMRYLVGEVGAQAIQTVILNSSREESGLSIGVGLVVVLVGASTVFQQLSTAFNRIWGVKPAAERGDLRAFLRKRILSFAMVLAIGFLLLVSLLLSALLSAAGRWFEPGQDPTWIWQSLNAAFSFLVITLLFATMFKFLPDAKIRWRHVWLGAAATALLFTAGKQVIGMYLGHSSIGSSFGAAGSIVVFTVWIYYASLLVFFGAKFTHLHAARSGERIVPEEFAERAS